MSSCIEHTQKGTGLGYGTTQFEGRTFGLHRAVYCRHHKLTRKDVAELSVRHTCDNPRCINVEHLLLGTHQANMDDKVARGRQVKGTQQRHAVLTAENIHYIREHYKPYCKVHGGKAIAAKFNVTQQTISLIATGNSWAHIQGVTYEEAL